jgi:sulfur-oxidizing protein SoxY
VNKNKHLHEDCGVGVDLARRRMAGVAGVGLIAASAATLWPLRTAQAQSAVIYTPLETLVAPITRGARLQRGRVRLELPILAENGNAVPLRVSVDSPMTQAEHVRSLWLLSDRNPVKQMAHFRLGPWSARAQIDTRVRLAGSQRVTALAQLSDDSFWFSQADITVTLSACVDGS